MSEPIFAITGATGKTGGAVIRNLIGRGAKVRAIVRAMDSRASKLQDLGAEVVVADLFEPLQMREALVGVHSMYFVPPWNPYAIQAGVVALTEAHRAGIRNIVLLSQWLGHPEHPSLLTRQSWLLEQLVRLIPDTNYVFVNPGFFADNFLGYGMLETAAQVGVLPNPLGERLCAPPSNDDIAAVVAECLVNTSAHHGKMYHPSGPELLSGEQMAEIVSKVLGRKVKSLPASEPMFAKTIKVTGAKFGVDAAQYSNLRWYIQDSKQGAWEVDAPNDDVLQVSGKEPESFEQIVRSYVDKMDLTPSRSKRRAQLLNVLKVALTRKPKIAEGVAIRLEPVPTDSKFALDSETWQIERAAIRG